MLGLGVAWGGKVSVAGAGVGDAEGAVVSAWVALGDASAVGV